MKISKDTIVTVHYTLTDAQNNVLDEGEYPLVYLHGGYENTLPSIERALEGREAGYSVTIQVEPEDAFGEYDASLVKVESREKLPAPIEIGMQFEGVPEGTDDEEEPVIYVVTDIAEDKVILDGNHPLAGMALRFTLNVADVRAATKEEIESQHPNIEDEEDDALGQQYRSVTIQ